MQAALCVNGCKYLLLVPCAGLLFSWRESRVQFSEQISCSITVYGVCALYSENWVTSVFMVTLTSVDVITDADSDIPVQKDFTCYFDKIAFLYLYLYIYYNMCLCS